MREAEPWTPEMDMGDEQMDKELEETEEDDNLGYGEEENKIPLERHLNQVQTKPVGRPKTMPQMPQKAQMKPQTTTPNPIMNMSPQIATLKLNEEKLRKELSEKEAILQEKEQQIIEMNQTLQSIQEVKIMENESLFRIQLINQLQVIAKQLNSVSQQLYDLNKIMSEKAGLIEQNEINESGEEENESQ